MHLTVHATRCLVAPQFGLAAGSTVPALQYKIGSGALKAVPLSLKLTARQSSTATGGGAARAVDGDAATASKTGAASKPWLAVNLGARRRVVASGRGWRDGWSTACMLVSKNAEKGCGEQKARKAAQAITRTWLTALVQTLPARD